MKLRRVLLFVGIIFGMTTLMSTSCEKDDDPNDPGSCTEVAYAIATGEVSGNFCFDQQLHFNYEEGSLIYFGAKQNGSPVYSLTVSVNTYGINGDPGLLVPGTYTCSYGEAGYVELVVHGESSEFYKSKSGSITITEMSDNTFMATFNVVTEGYTNGGAVNLTGTVNMTEVNIP